MDINTHNTVTDMLSNAMQWSMVLLPVVTLLVVATVVMVVLCYWETSTIGRSWQHIKECYLKIRKDIEEQKALKAKGKITYIQSHLDK